MSGQHDDRHAPAPEFRARLEEKITAEYRRAGKPASRILTAAWSTPSRERRLTVSGRFSRWQRIRTAALVVVALAVGAAGGVAYGQVQDARERSSLREVAQVELQVAQQREQLARLQHEQMRRNFDIGIVTRESLSAAETDLRVAEGARRRAELNLAEIELRAATPRDDLAAPTVRGRDFVRERLQVELGTAEVRLREAQREAAEVARRHELGLVSPLAVMEARQQQRQLEFAVAVHARRLELRQQFVDGTLTYGEVADRAHGHELEHALQLAAGRHELAAARLERVQEQYRLGAVDRTTLLRAELELAERLAELDRYRAQRDSARVRPR